VFFAAKTRAYPISDAGACRAGGPRCAIRRRIYREGEGWTKLLNYQILDGINLDGIDLFVR
jgi:hypothetical protein